MAYYIFLKSLRSLEEFKKNPHAKIPPKSLSTNFQSLDKFKNPFFIWKRIFLRFRPNRPSGQPTRPASQLSQPPAFSPTGCARARPISTCVAVMTPSPSVTAKGAPPVSSIFHLAPADPGHAAASLGHPAPPRLCLEMPSQGVNSPP
mgnify:CR=1 FL=1